MSTLPRRQYGVIVTIAIAVIGAAVAGAVLFTSGKASDVDLTTAKLTPGDAGVYFALNTDLSSSQWVAMFDLIERLGEEDPRDELERSVEDEGGFDWEDDVVPFLGGNAAVFLKAADVNTFDFQGGVIVRCKDAKKALEIFMDQSGDDFDKDDYHGQQYYIGSGSDLYAANVDGHLVVTSDEQSMFDVLDAAQGRTKSLADSQDFKSLRDELTKNFIGFLYFNSEQFAGDFFGDDETFRTAINQAGAGDLAFKPMAVVFGAKDAGFEVHEASLGKPGVLSPMLAPRESRFAKIVPGDTAVFISTAGLAQTFDEVVKAAREEIDDALAAGSPYSSLEDALRDAGRPLGLGSARDVIELFSGETAIAVWFPTGDSNAPAGLLLAQVKDENQARDVVEALVREGKAKTRTEQVNGVDMVTVDDRDGSPAAYAITDGSLLIGTVEGVRTTLERKGPMLAEMKGYRASVAQIETSLGTYAYFNLNALLRLRDNGVPEQLDEATRVLDGLIINLVSERDVVRLSGAVSIGK
ncbi:MAG: DUF3352 domain-containing protein [Chloroflexi bacterium]|nr:DUF3352 domain-containing protein [Chloroflexota bacterium]